MGQSLLQDGRAVVRHGTDTDGGIPTFARDVNLEAAAPTPLQHVTQGGPGRTRQTLACCYAGSSSGPTRLYLHAHQGLEAGLILAGEEEHQYGNLRVSRTSGEVWLSGPWEPHAWRVISPTSTKVFLIFLPQFLGEDPLGPAPYLSLFALPPDRRFEGLSRVVGERVLAIGRDMVSEMEERRPLWDRVLRLHLLRFLSEAMRACDRPEVLGSEPLPHADGTALARIIPAVKLVQTGPQRRVSGPAAAAACSLSPSRFYHLFRSAMGVSFGAFALRARLAHAAQCLLHTDAALHHVAEESGFADASHLHRTFVRHYGCTPGKYRAQAR